MSLPHDSLGGLSPFEVVHGYAPRVEWDWKIDLPDSATPADKLNTQQAVDYAARQRTAWNTARSSLLEAQAKMARSYNRSRRAADFDVDDRVWLDMRYFTITRSFKEIRLSNKWTISSSSKGRQLIPPGIASEYEGQ